MPRLVLSQIAGQSPDRIVVTAKWNPISLKGLFYSRGQSHFSVITITGFWVRVLIMMLVEILSD